MIPTFSTRVKIDAPDIRADRILDLNRNARTRATAGRYINHGSRQLIEIIQQIADAELKEDRPQERRRTQGPRYRDSWDVMDNHVDNIGRLVGGIYSTHHAARLIENGSPPHAIPQAGTTYLAFPFQPGATRSKKGGPKGNWPVNFGEGLEWSGDTAVSSDFFGDAQVMHPGSPAFKIVERARRRYRERARAGR